nr:ribonuclease P protein component [Candidatus Hydrogenosomobacter endosymbioticus]
MKSRREFLALKSGSSSCKFFYGGSLMCVVQTADAAVGGESCLRWGSVVSKRVGSAVVRNRIKRRLRAIFSEFSRSGLKSGFRCVVIVKSATFSSVPFDAIVENVYKKLLSIRGGVC